MRIVGGQWRGRKLADVGDGDAAAHLRPTTDRIRESLFNLLMNGRHGNLVTGARVLDLFAGTGALGLEALSRGAVHATFIDDGIRARALLRDNIARCGAQGMTRMFRRDATELGSPPGKRFDLVFLDPPYGRGLGEAAVGTAMANGWLTDGAHLVWEEEAPPHPPTGLRLLDQRSYGRTTISLLRRET